jgi:formiminotetrahydrofolate cyclodeaminase
MVAGLTLGRPRYAAYGDEMVATVDQARVLQARLLALVDADTRAYAAVFAAQRLPKDTEAERAARAGAIQAALAGAVDTPLATAEACAAVLELAAHAAAHGNRNASSDAAVAAYLAHAGLRGAAHSARANLTGIRDADFRAAKEVRVAALLTAGEAALSIALRSAGTGA